VLGQIFDSKVVTAKIFKPLKLSLAHPFTALTYFFMAQREVLSQWKFIDRVNREDMRGEEIAMAKVSGADSQNIACRCVHASSHT
jgi:hypothetical protein